MQTIALASHAADAVTALLRPRSIAILGASDRSRWSESVTGNLARGGFPGHVHLVNRRGGMAHGRQTAVDCSAVGEAIDVGIVMVPAQGMLEAIDDLGAAGAKAAVLLSSGFAETGAAGAALQAQLTARARACNVRLMGPNSLGFINFTDRVHAWTTPVRAPSRAAGVAIVSQSGATAYFLAELAWQQDVALSVVAATGNEADLDAASFLDYLVDDPHTRAIALFIETVRQPARFLAAARRAFDAGKPVVVLKVGASEATMRAAVAHTGALVGDDAVFDGVCRQCGIIRVRSIEELLATADIAGRLGRLGAGGLAIISNSGGICEIAADSAEQRGMRVPPLTPEVAAHVAALMPGFGTPHNPLDLTGAVEPDKCGEIVRQIAGQAGFAAVVCVVYPIPLDAGEENERLSAVHQHLSTALNQGPIPGLLTCYTHTPVNAHARAIVERIAAPYSAFGLDRVISALAGLMWWSTRQREAHGVPFCAIASALEPAAFPAAGERAALDYLAGHGVPVVPATLARDETAAVAAARAFGGAVVLKVAAAGIAHKSDMGGVALNLTGDAQVAAAFCGIIDSVHRHQADALIDGVLVSPMRERGVELIVGMARDPVWGPVLAVGLGGIWVETLKDVALRVLPVDANEARRMLTELRGAPMLAGQRGIPPADLDTLAQAIGRIAHAAQCLGPTLEAMDVNPLWVRGSAVEALDALLVRATAVSTQEA